MEIALLLEDEKQVGNTAKIQELKKSMFSGKMVIQQLNNLIKISDNKFQNLANMSNVAVKKQHLGEINLQLARHELKDIK